MSIFYTRRSRGRNGKLLNKLKEWRKAEEYCTSSGYVADNIASGSKLKCWYTNANILRRKMEETTNC